MASSVGRPFETKPRFTACGALWWLKPQSGIVVSVHGIVEARAVPGVAAIEGNGRQYCPAGNRGWEDRYPTMFHITDGALGTGALDGPGLGFSMESLA